MLDRPSAQTAILGEVDHALLERMRHEALVSDPPWRCEYGKYQSGGWWTTSLMNASGNAGDVLIGDCQAQPTDLLERMPATRSFLAGQGLTYMWVRLARLEPNAFLWEHRDYDELSDVERHRIHVPLNTNSSAFLVTGGTKVHMASGLVWQLTPTHAHGVCNMLGPDRIHLIADVYADDAYRAYASAAREPDNIIRLRRPSHAMLTEQVEHARNLAAIGCVETAEQHLLRLFYAFDLPEGAIYDLIIDLHTGLGDGAAAEKWLTDKRTLLALTGAQAAQKGI